jgi:uncharacterized protein
MSENRLRHETSPYLLQHQDNPVHWWAWGPDALAEAKRSGKPILLSVGYAACHWCHVMAHESFEDDATAAVMNDLFVNIKVDREERPDIDAIYMGALHRLGEHGGWPLTMFLDAEARPFWGGTYFPKEARYGKPSFERVLRQVAHIYANDRETVDHNAATITAMLTERADGPAFTTTDAAIENVTARLLRAIDPDNGGLQGAPKFPQWSFFWLLWRGAIRYQQPLARSAVEKTLIHICQGGIYDHLGGGFSRYTVDERWLVPHFEKMLYDNALLIDLMTEVYREGQNPLFAVRIAETVDFLAREMMAGGGAFASSLDADSEGEEGKFYVWTLDEVSEVLGPDVAKVFGRIYDVTPAGNWEGHAILNRLQSRELMSEPEEAKLAELRAKLLARRASRIRPGFDDKVLADWNGLMIGALARASEVFDKPDWLAMAERAFAFITTTMLVDGRLHHSYRAGQMTASATSADYANMIFAAVRLHQATGDARYLDAALRFTATLDARYWVADPGGYATTADDTTDVIVRLRAAQDDAVPNANAMMLTNLMHLFLITGDPAFADRAHALQSAFAPDVARALVSHTGFLANSIDVLAPQMVVIAGSTPGDDALKASTRKVSLPGALIYTHTRDSDQTLAPQTLVPMGLAGKIPLDGRAAAYVCLGPACSLPIEDQFALSEALRTNRTAHDAV